MPRSRSWRSRRCEGCECGIRHNQEDEFYSSEDWNGGFLGHGSAGARYYQYGVGMREIISRMLMNGRRGAGDNHNDMTLGWIYGIRINADDQYLKEDVNVGFKGNAGFKIPRCE